MWVSSPYLEESLGYQYIISELASLTNSRRGFTLASKTKMWLSAHRAEQWSSLGWRLQRLAPLTSLAAVGRRRRAAAHKRGDGCWDGSQRAWSAAACYQAVGTGAVLAVVRWLSSAAAVLRFNSRKANLGKGIQLSSISKSFWLNYKKKFVSNMNTSWLFLRLFWVCQET